LADAVCPCPSVIVYGNRIPRTGAASAGAATLAFRQPDIIEGEARAQENLAILRQLPGV